MSEGISPTPDQTPKEGNWLTRMFKGDKEPVAGAENDSLDQVRANMPEVDPDTKEQRIEELKGAAGESGVVDKNLLQFPEKRQMINEQRTEASEAPSVADPENLKPHESNTPEAPEELDKAA